MQETITSLYGNRTRIRVCGLCWKDDRLLMVNHRMVDQPRFWAPPGGGVEFGQRVAETLAREFLEETGLVISVAHFRFITEFIAPPLHALELFFDVRIIGGNLRTGTDPEMPPGEQLIQAVTFMDWVELMALPEAHRHGIFRHIDTVKDLQTLTGFYRI